MCLWSMKQTCVYTHRIMQLSGGPEVTVLWCAYIVLYYFPFTQQLLIIYVLNYWVNSYVFQQWCTNSYECQNHFPEMDPLKEFNLLLKQFYKEVPRWNCVLFCWRSWTVVHFNLGQDLGSSSLWFVTIITFYLIKAHPITVSVTEIIYSIEW